MPKIRYRVCLSQEERTVLLGIVSKDTLINKSI